MDAITSTIPPWTLGYIATSIALSATTTLKLLSPYSFFLFFEKLLEFQVFNKFLTNRFGGHLLRSPLQVNFHLDFLLTYFSGILVILFFSIMFLPQLERQYLKKRSELLVMLCFLFVVVTVRIILECLVIFCNSTISLCNDFSIY